MNGRRMMQMQRVAAGLGLLASLLVPAGKAATEQAGSEAPGISLTEYRAKLVLLEGLVTRCEAGRNASTCSKESVGPDDLLETANGKKQIRYGWLRLLLGEAAQGREIAGQSGNDADAPGQLPPLAERFWEAHRRLEEEVRLADEEFGARASGSMAQQRKLLVQILDAKEFHPAVRQPTLMDRVFEKVGNWINRAIGGLVARSSKSRWIGLTAEIGFVVLLCTGLVWFLIRLERQSGLGIGRLRVEVGEGAASARDWQLWLADAHKAAAEGCWRDAIHLLYWASISRLESGGMWPADRARTPREYLALVSDGGEKQLDLALLTRSFERIWYAGAQLRK